MSFPLLIVFPPGWDVCVPGPYLAGPLIKGFARAQGIDAHCIDLNNEIATEFVPRISRNEALRAIGVGGIGMDELYFGREAVLQKASAAFGGDWTIRDSFQPAGMDPGSSESVRAYLDTTPPYDAFATSRIAALLHDLRPGVVGITITIPGQIYGALYVAKLLKKLAPDIVLALGGNIPTRLSAEMSLPWVFDLVDVLVTNQGEETLVALAGAGGNRDLWSKIPNLRYRANGGIERTSSQLLQRASFAAPDYSDVAFASYWGDAYAPIVASRGCYYGKCSFCAIPFAWGNGGFLGTDDPREVALTMERCIEKFGIGRFKFIDESLHPKLVAELSERLSSDGASVEWEGYARMDSPWFDRTLLRTAARAGLRKLYVGLELMAGTSRLVLHKNDQPDARDFLLRLKDEGILVHLFLLAGHPGTSETDARRTLEFALDHQGLIDTLDVNGFRYEKHTMIPGVVRQPNPSRDWALEDPFATELAPSLGSAEIDSLEEMMFKMCRAAVPRWVHPIYYLSSPWASLSGAVGSVGAAWNEPVDT